MQILHAGKKQTCEFQPLWVIDRSIVCVDHHGEGPGKSFNEETAKESVILRSLEKANLHVHIRSVSGQILIGFTEVDKVDTSCFSVDSCYLLKVIYMRNLKHCHRIVLSEGRVLNRRKSWCFSLVDIFLCTTFDYFIPWPSERFSYLKIFTITFASGYIGLCVASVLIVSVLVGFVRQGFSV